MTSNGIIRFEEQNYDMLVEKLIKKCQEEWMEIVEAEYEKANNQEPPDRMEER